MAPAKAACKSCPYRRDVPSGIWDADEYEKLPDYDAETAYQPIGVFQCHQQNGRICAGWAGCHDMTQSLALRLASSFGHISDEDLYATLDYESPVALFESGAQAAAHGLAALENPDSRARRAIARLEHKQARRNTG
jgi:hypothetical protein